MLADTPVGTDRRPARNACGLLFAHVTQAREAVAVIGVIGVIGVIAVGS
jgi:hypothetical protein